MIAAYTLDVHGICQSVQAATFENRRQHRRYGLDIVNIWEENIQVVLEHLSVVGQEVICQCPQKICEILVPMKADPMHAVIQDHPRLYDFLCKIRWVYPPALQFLKIDSTLLEDVN